MLLRLQSFINLKLNLSSLDFIFIFFFNFGINLYNVVIKFVIILETNIFSRDTNPSGSSSSNRYVKLAKSVIAKLYN